MSSRFSEEEKLDRIVDRLQCLYYQLNLPSFRSRLSFERAFALKGFRGLLQFNRIESNLTLSITLLTTLGSPLHQFEISILPKDYGTEVVDFCAFTSLPYKQGQALSDLKIGFITQVPFETYIRQMVLTSCKRDRLLTPLVACLERATNLMELEKNYRD